MDVSCIDNEAEFQAVATDWNRLAGLTAPDSVFLRHEWNDAAWQWLKQDCQMAILCVKLDGRVVGLWPLVVRSGKYHGIPLRSLEFLSVPDTQSCDILSEPDERPAVIAALVNYLGSPDIRWDRLELDKLGLDSNAMQGIPEQARSAALAFETEQTGANPGISLQQTWDEYYSHRSRRLKKGNNHAANRLQRSESQVALSHLDEKGWTAENVTPMLATITGLSAKSWKNSTGLTLENPGPSAFISRLTEHAHKQGWLSIWLLKFDDVPVAMEYQLVYGGVISALRSDYDPAYENLSPGTYMNWKMLEQLFNGAYRYYSMGPGGNAYKLRWAEELPDQHRITIYNRTLRGWLLGIMELKLRPMKRTIDEFLKKAREKDGS